MADQKAVQPIYEDSQYDSAKALTAFQKLADSDQVDVLIVLGTPPVTSVLPAAERRGIPMFAWTTSSRLTAGHPLAIRIIPTGAAAGEVMANAAKKQGLRKVSFFSAQNEYSQTVRDGFVENFKGTSDAPVEQVEFVPADMDFRAALTKSRTRKPDGVGICLNTGQIPAFIQQFKQLGMTSALFGCHAMSSNSVAQVVAEQGLKAWFVEGTVSEEFESKFKAKYSDVSGIWVGAAYHDVGLLLLSSDWKKLFAEKDIEAKVSSSAFVPPAYFSSSAGDKFLTTPLGTTRIEDGKFIRRQ